MADETTPEVTAPAMPEVAAHDGAMIGDDNIAPIFTPVVTVVQDTAAAQVMGSPAAAVNEVHVYETSVVMDHVVLDPSSPEAVQIPDAGRGTLDLPLHGLGGETVEAYFAKHGQSDE